MYFIQDRNIVSVGGGIFQLKEKGQLLLVDGQSLQSLLRQTIHLFNRREAPYQSSRLFHSYACLIYYRSQITLCAEHVLERANKFTKFSDFTLAQQTITRSKRFLVHLYFLREKSEFHFNCFRVINRGGRNEGSQHLFGFNILSS